MADPYRFLSEDEFLALPPSRERVELVDGELVVSPSALPVHQAIVFDVARALRDWAEARGEGHAVYVSPLDVHFGPGRILQPDVVVFPAPVPPRELPVRARPCLVVEVLSSNRDHDRRTKRFVYAGAGVPEFWCLDPEGLVEVFSGEHLRTRAAPAHELVSPTLPGLVLRVDDLLAATRAPRA